MKDWVSAIVAGCALLGAHGAEVPRLEDGRFRMSLFAEHPQIWTPTGIAVDAQGRVFVIESNTHLPKPNYDGPKLDRVLVFADENGRAGKGVVFAEGFRAAMNLTFGPKGELYVVERNGVQVLDEKGAATQVVSLETKGDFPHNGLGGVCIGPDGMLYLGFGENLGLSYTLKGSDGSKASGGGEGGNVFRCTLAGGKVERFATGFWNPFSLAFDLAGNLFAVDNDADGRPPCRLAHVVEGGNYGYQFRYGRSGLHPFVAWDGELPGTLPMVAGTGEAPSGLLWCAALGWPEEYGTSLISTSWGDNSLETFPLEARGISFKAERKVFARGDASFRPVAMAAGKDGTVYITDWADKEYAVHRKGRIWRLQGPAEKARGEAREAAAVVVEHPDDPFVEAKAIRALAKLGEGELRARFETGVSRERLFALLALREKEAAPGAELLRTALRDGDEDIRRMAMIWAAERRVEGLQEDLLAAVMRAPQSLTLLQTYLAAVEIFEGYEKESVWSQGSTGATLVQQLIKDPTQPAALRELATKLRATPQIRPAAGAPVAEPATRPKSESEWLAAIGFGGEAGPGRELFFSEKTGCAKCHRAQGQGGAVGPDLSVVGRASDRAKLVNSILQPSANIGPLYVTHEVTTKAGAAHAGLAPEGTGGAAVVLILADGRRVEIPRGEIAAERTSAVSLMPAGVEAGLSVREFADLIRYLETLK